MSAPLRYALMGMIVGGCSLRADTSSAPAGETDTALSDIPLEQLAQVPVEFVTGASKYEQSIQRAPASVTVLTADDIRNYGWRTLADALRSAPGFHIRSDRFYDYVGNRGFTRPYDFNSRTLVLINGHRLNDPIYQAGAIGTEFILDLDMIERIEIIRGPSSSLYGSSAFYGAINIIPKKGRDLSGGQASANLSSEPGVKGRVSMGNRTASGVEYTISATEWWLNGEDDYKLPQDWRDVTLLPDTETSGHDETHHQSVYANATWRGFETEAAFVRRKKDVLPPVYYTNLDDPAFGIDTRAYALGRVSGHPTEDSTLSAKLGFDYYGYEGEFSPAFTNFETQRPYAKSVSMNFETRWQQEFASRHIFIAGLEHQQNFIQNLGRDNLDTNTSVVRVRESSYYVSPFAQVDWNLARGLWLSTGGRFDSYSTGEEQFTPRFGLIWEASSSTTFKLLYGESFRVPNVEERYSAEAGIVANPDLGPESNESWEFVVDHRINPVWQVDGHVYRTVSSDLIQAVLISTAPDIYSNQNSQKIVTEGVEAGASAYFPSNVQVRGSVTLQRAYDTSTDETVADAPHALFKLNASAPIIERWLRLSGELQYVGDRKDTNGEHLGDYITTNVTLRAIRVWKRWDLSLSVYNLFNDRWSDAKNSGNIVSPPRTLVGRATFDF